MQIYFSPEVLESDIQILNIVDDRENAVGYFTYMKTEKKLYLYGLLENEGVYEDFKDLLNPYIQGLLAIHPDSDVYNHFTVGGKKVEITGE